MQGKTPFFFRRAPEGTFSGESSDFRSVVVSADAGTGGRNFNVMLGVGDNLGRTYRVTIPLKGNDREGLNI